MNTNGTFELIRSEEIKEYSADKLMKWKQFRQWILNQSERFATTTIFRGHARATYSLKTSFHRTGRRNLFRYTYEDVRILCRDVEATLDTRYNLDDANDFGGLLYLAQHHGFPTPLLDWTTSPFVAAYFAFENADQEVGDNNAVRVLLFNLDGWPHNNVGTIGVVMPTFARLNLRATQNPRALPQQYVPMSQILSILKDSFAERKNDLTVVSFRGSIFQRRNGRQP